MPETGVDIGGIVIPSGDPFFLGVIAVHVAAALVCVVAGVVAMFSRKGEKKHIRSGRIYYWGLSVVFATATIVAVMRWREDYHLFIIGTLAFLSATIARKAVRQKKYSLHVICMGFSYIAMLTAFYVDNGKNLPLWKELPVAAYWTLPAIVGVPVIIYVLLRHPLLHRSKK